MSKFQIKIEKKQSKFGRNRNIQLKEFDSIEETRNTIDPNTSFLANDEPEELLDDQSFQDNKEINDRVDSIATNLAHHSSTKPVDNEDDNESLLTQELERMRLQEENKILMSWKKEEDLSVDSRSLDSELKLDESQRRVVSSFHNIYHSSGLSKPQKPKICDPIMFIEKDEQEERINSSIDITEENLELQKQLEDWERKGVEAAEKEDYQLALGYFNRILFLRPQNHIIYEYRAQIYLDIGEIIQAVQSIEKSIQCNPNWYVAYNTLARCQREMGELYLARSNITKSFERYVHTTYPNLQAVPFWFLRSNEGSQGSDGKVATDVSSQSYEVLRSDVFVLELKSEAEGLDSLIQEQEKKKKLYFEKMKISQTEDQAEVNRCFYNLASRARSREQLQSRLDRLGRSNR
jgi:tetratricopeptide (TPR) repeat protein